MRKRVAQLEGRLSIIALLGALLVGMLLMLYIFQVNFLTAKVYGIQDQESALEHLKEGSRALEGRHLQSLSAKHMAALALHMRFERIQEITYLRIPASTVAQTTNQ
tara:strand:+ start:8532 stop:8849 length:318 start_codon:yes stop_codon:yes gene_type:complete